MIQQSNFPSEHPDWGVADIGFVGSPQGHWGIGTQELIMAIELLRIPRRGIITSEEAPDRLTFSQFELLLRVLDPDVAAGMRIDDAIRLRYEQELGEQNDASYITALQESLNALLSTAQTRLPVDGVWTPAADEALHTVGQAYNLTSIKRNADLLAILQTIAGRLPRWACEDPALRERIGYNPFLTMDDGAPDFELSNAKSGIVLRHRVSKEMLCDFPANNNRMPDTFPQFTAWLAMLHYKPNKPRHLGTIEIRLEDGEWQALDTLDGGETAQFAITPDYCLHVPNPSVRFHVRIHPLLSSELDFIGVWLNADFALAITPGYAVDAEGREIVRYFDSEYFFRNLDGGSGGPEGIAISKKANYFKLFVVNRNFPSKANMGQYRSFAGTETHSAFYRLLTAHEMDIHEGLTFALSDASARPFNGKWVLLAGTGDRELPEAEQWMAEALGVELAKQGYGLMLGGWPGVDEHTATAFARHLEAAGIPDQERLRQVLEANQIVRYALGQLQRLSSTWVAFSKAWYKEVAKLADALVVVGGKSGTERIVKAAQDVGLPVFPLPGSGGAARRAFDAMAVNTGNPSPVSEAMAAKITTQAAAVGIARVTIQALDATLLPSGVK